MQRYLQRQLSLTLFLASTFCLLSFQAARSDTTTPEVDQGKAHIQEDSIPAARMMGKTYNSQLGKRVINPVSPRTQVQQAYCATTCDMFVPRQAIVYLKVPQPETQTPQGDGSKANTRIDITAVAEGFEKGSFATIEVDSINPLKYLPQSSSVPFSSDAQILVNQVRDWQIVERPASLPVYRSSDTMMKLLPAASDSLKTILNEELRTGSLSQVRVLGKSSQNIKGQSYNVISMVGLSPGLTYQFRAVEKASPSTATVSTQGQCHVPVCPADFVQ